MDRDLYAGYEETLKKFRHDFSRGGAYTGMALVLGGVLLDYAFYPGYQFRFWMARLLCSALIYCVIAVMETEWGKSRISELTFVWLLFPQIMIAWMIGTTEGAASIYYSGLNLAIYASGIVLAFGLWQNIVFGLVSLLMYVAACSFHQESLRIAGALMVNTLFLLMSIVVSAVFTFFNEKARFMLFMLKTELSRKNSELEETNRNLAQIKGQMLQQEKMAAIGTLSAGLLHEVNNPVNYSLMAMEVALEDPVARASASLNECLKDAREGMQRIRHIVSDLKTFAYRTGETERKEFPFGKAVDSAFRLVGHETRGISITRDMPEDTLVRGDEAAVIGVLVNLIGNSAMALNSMSRSNPSIHLSATWRGDRLFVSVQDNGPGIAPENIGRVFEPFFTTREIGHGLGLGLSISYGVIERHGGTLRAESVLGEWTTMIFDLPKAL